MLNRTKIYNYLKVLLIISHCMFNFSLMSQTDTMPGQVIQFEKVLALTGLSPLSSDSFCQDSEGFLWLGTKEGLYKYDGYNLTQFFHDPNDPKSINDNWVYTITEDDSGILWIGTRKGIQLFDKKKETFSAQYKNTDFYVLGFRNNIMDMFLDSKGFMWIGTNSDIFRFDRKTEQLISFKPNQDIPENKFKIVNDIAEDEQSNIWIGTENGLLRIIPNDNNSSLPQYTWYRHHENENSLSNNYILNLEIGSEGEIWIGTLYNGIDKMVLDKINGEAEFINYSHKEDDPTSLTNNAVTSLYEDSQGRLWIGIVSGLNIFDKHNGTMRSFFNEQEYTIDNINVDSQGLIWVGNESGMLLFNPQTLSFGFYNKEENNDESISSDLVTSVLVDSKGIFWLGTMNNGLNQYNAPNGFIHHQHDNSNTNSVSSNIIGAIYEDSQENLWVGTMSGLDKVTFK